RLLRFQNNMHFLGSCFLKHVSYSRVGSWARNTRHMNLRALSFCFSQFLLITSCSSTSALVGTEDTQTCGARVSALQTIWKAENIDRSGHRRRGLHRKSCGPYIEASRA